MAITYAEVDKFKKIVIIYNRNSGKQLFASMIMKINEIYKRLKAELGSKTVELQEIKRFDDIPAIAEALEAEQVDWVIIAGGDGTIRAMIEQLANRKYLPYISVFPLAR